MDQPLRGNLFPSNFPKVTRSCLSARNPPFFAGLIKKALLFSRAPFGCALFQLLCALLSAMNSRKDAIDFIENKWIHFRLCFFSVINFRLIYFLTH